MSERVQQGDADRDDTVHQSRTNVFDIRNIIGSLLLLYGVILLVTSFTTSTAERARVDGINANLWVGIGLLLIGGFMVGWAALRPVEIDEAEVEADKQAVEEAAGRRPGDGTDAPG